MCINFLLNFKYNKLKKTFLIYYYKLHFFIFFLISKSLTLVLKFHIYKKIKIKLNRKIIMGSVLTCCSDPETAEGEDANVEGDGTNPPKDKVEKTEEEKANDDVDP